MERVAVKENEALLKISGLVKTFGGLMALDQVDISLKGKEIVAIIGPNGAGKTTLFNCITGVYRAQRGEILFEGESILGLPPHEIVKKGIVRTFQNIRLFRNMTVLENVLVGMHTRLKAGILSSVLKIRSFIQEEEFAKERASQLLKEVGLLGLEDQLANSLPYGLQRRLELARAISSFPRLLLLDEPTAGMNPRESKEITQLLHKIHSVYDIGILIIEHDMRVVMEVSDRIIVLDLGRKIAEGTAEEIREDQKVIEAYLGKRWREIF